MMDKAYRGYTIRKGLVGDWFIGKDGHFFSCVRSEKEAMAAIDLLVD